MVEHAVALGAVLSRSDRREPFDLSMLDGGIVVEVECDLFAIHGEGGRRHPLGVVPSGALLCAVPVCRGTRVIAVPSGDGAMARLAPGLLARSDQDRELRLAMHTWENALALIVGAPESTELPAALGELAATRVERDAARFDSLRATRVERTKQVGGRFRGMLGSLFAAPNEILAIDPNSPPQLRACRHVAILAGVPVDRIPRRLLESTDRPPHQVFAMLAGCGVRDVVLEGRWWELDHGPVLAFSTEGDPMALYPVPGGTMAQRYVHGRGVPATLVDEAAARAIRPNASIFLPALPDEVRDVRGLVRFMLAGSVRDLVWAASAAGIASLIGLLVPYATGMLVEYTIPSDDLRGLWFVAAMLVAAISASAVAQFVSRLYLLRTEGRAGQRAIGAVVQRLISLPAPFFKRFNAGDLTDRLGCLDALQSALTQAAIGGVIGGTFAIGYLALMLLMEPFAALVAAMVMVAMLMFTVLIVRSQARLSADSADRSGKLSGFALQLFGGIDTIRTAGGEEAALMQWLQRFRRQQRTELDASKRGAALRVVATCVPLGAIALLWPIFAASGASLGAYMAFNAAFVAAIFGVIQLGESLGDLATILPHLHRLEPILQEEPERLESALQPGPLRGNLALSNVRFGYPGSADEVLKGVSIEIPSGASVAIVGASGSGKSTIIRLLLGLERPGSGRVLIDGQDLARLDPVAVRRQMGVVMQKGQIIPGTVAENILGSTVLTLDDAWSAAERAGLAEDIEAMPMGMHTNINASTLSGGQQQKVLLARALLGQPRVVVLDEATSALDEQSQATVVESMERLDVTRIAVAHRVSTIRTCDRIYVIDRGVVAQQGTFDDLLAQPGAFRRLVERQLADLEPGADDESFGESADDDSSNA
ncbi:MAG: ATP-binding cassette domain-containing protein [Phycisphaerae bacterium]|nr:ATP-binding cassette domain-containing protein [Phycisphaerae bacterium]